MSQGIETPPLKWGIGVLVWNNQARCRQTIKAIKANLVGDYQITVLDNGSDKPFTGDAGVIRSEINLGAGGGMSHLVDHLLRDGADRVLFVEDDWDLERPLALADLEPLVSDPKIGQVRLGVRPHRPSDKYWTYALEGATAARSLKQADSPYHAYPGGEYQSVRLLWSNNPFACRRDIAERFLLTKLDELRMARPYLASGLLTASTTPGHFRHMGEPKSRRIFSGWKK